MKQLIYKGHELSGLLFDPETGHIFDRQGKRAERMKTQGLMLDLRTVESVPFQAVSVHRAIYESVFGEIPKGQSIIHINGDKEDNRPSNLKSVFLSETKPSLKKIAERKAADPEDTGLAPLIPIIRERHANGAHYKELAKEFALTPTTILAILCPIFDPSNQIEEN